jgi:hypothetical protein
MPRVDEVKYFGRIEEIYELNFYGSKSHTPVISNVVDLTLK